MDLKFSYRKDREAFLNFGKVRSRIRLFQVIFISFCLFIIIFMHSFFVHSKS